jgi:hypothetical protein
MLLSGIGGELRVLAHARRPIPLLVLLTAVLLVAGVATPTPPPSLPILPDGR